ncbi:sensor histidine kinase [Arthrobacter psychrolactophilus]
MFSLAAIGLGIEDGTVPDPENAGLEWARFGFAPIFAPLGAIALIWRHRFPKSVAAATAVLSSLSISGIAFFIALYLLSRRRLSWWVAAVIALYLVVETFVGIGPMSWGLALAIVLLLAAIAAWGAYRGQKARTKAAQLASFKDRAERTEAQRIADTERTQLAERTRIAREMHDTIAHRMSLVAVQAAALQVDAPDSETAQFAQQIRETAHAALSELRDVLGVLHEGSGNTPQEQRTAPSGIGEIEELLAQWRQTGMDISYQAPVEPLPSMPDAISRAAYRVVQEGITNVARHAPEAAATVTLFSKTMEEARELMITVINGPSTGADASEGAGLGLIGLRERVELLGGSLEHGATGQGASQGFQLKARIPFAVTHDSETQEVPAS